MIVWNEYSQKSNGGTELLARELQKRLPESLLNEFQIFPSRVRGELDETKIRILWCHDTEDDPEMNVLHNEGWRKFHKIVFVSHHQKSLFQKHFNIPASRCVVLHNAIIPFEEHQKPDPADGVRIVYTSTPHRGLNILAAVFRELRKNDPNIFLDVYSSFGLYGWSERDKEWENVFTDLESQEGVTLHGTVPNDEIRKALIASHIFAYPSIWKETSCLCLIEAMSADLLCVHSDLAALYETSAMWTVQYPFHEDPSKHAGIFLGAMQMAIQRVRMKTGSEPSSQKMYTDLFYNWDTRILQWEALLKSLLNEPREIEVVDDVFTYEVR